jgi:hypothetical protein
MKNNSKTVKVKANTPKKYLQLFNGIFNLTKKESEVLAVFIALHLSLKAKRVQLNAFSTEMKKEAAKELGKADFNTLNIYIKRLAEKKAISKTDDGYEIHRLLVPEGENRIIFKLLK